MIIPVRCFSCGKVVGSKWKEYTKFLADGKSIKEALDSLKLEKFCCRNILMSHVETIDTVGRYK